MIISIHIINIILRFPVGAQMEHTYRDVLVKEWVYSVLLTSFDFISLF